MINWIIKSFGGYTKEEFDALQDALFKSQMNDQPRDSKTGRFIKKKF